MAIVAGVPPALPAWLRANDIVETVGQTADLRGYPPTLARNRPDRRGRDAGKRFISLQFRSGRARGASQVTREPRA